MRNRRRRRIRLHATIYDEIPSYCPVSSNPQVSCLSRY